MNAMKKLFLLSVLMLTLTVVYGQRSIDNLFEKYAGKEGFVSVTLSGDLLKLASCFDDELNEKSIPANITQIRILAQDNENQTQNNDNFYDLVIKGIKVGDYEEFMSVKKTNQDLKMYVRAEGLSLI